MKLQDLKNRKWNYPWLAFGFTFLCFLAVMIVKGFTPFGDSSMLYSDNYHQYFPFFSAFRKALRSGDSLLYTWDIGMGLDYLGLISYYLASPLNLLSVILPEVLVLPYFSLLVPIKMAFASLFFALFLKKTFEQDDLSVTLFGCFYGLCAWALAYQWNIMWLDPFMLLPLVILGMLALLNRRRFMLYTLTLFLAVYSNYYIGFFICIFVLLAFICYEICRWHDYNKFCIDLVLMAFFSALAIGMTAFLELPTLAALQNTQSSVNSFPTGFKLNIASENTWKGLLDAMRQVAGNMNGGLEPTFKEGLPNLYCGLFANAFAFLFLFGKKIHLRDKVCAVVLLLFFNISFIIRQLDYIWHGFHFTNMIPYRFSFLYSFVLLYVAYRAYMIRHSFKMWQVISAGVLSIGLVLCSDSRTDIFYLAYNLAFLLLYCYLLLYPMMAKKLPDEATEEEVATQKRILADRRVLCSQVMLAVFALELILNVMNFGINFNGTSIAYYPRGKENTASMIRYMKEREWDTLFYRAETTHSQTLNDGALNDYHGISAFSSSVNVNVTEFMRMLGYGAKNTYNRYCFEESSPVANLFLGLKYMLERQGKVEDNPYFTDIHSYGNVHLLENNAYLPLGFLTEMALDRVPFVGNDDAFDFQNELFSAATAIQEPVWTHLYGDEVLQITSEDVEITSTSPQGYCEYTAGSESGRITYSYTPQQDGFVCVWLDLPKRNNFTLWYNGNELYSETYSLPQMLSVCQVSAGDTVEVALSCKANEKSNMRISAAVLNDDIFQAGYNILSQSTLELTEFRSTYVEGEILANRDGLLYTSIPQDGNWQVYLDGEPVEYVLVGDVMIGIPMTKGYHTVSFQYHNSAFSLGWKISLGCAVVVFGLYFWIYPTYRRKGKYER